MTEVFFLYYEEHDWAAHIEKAGYKIYYQGNSLVLHKESIATVKDSPFQIYYLHRGRMLFARRNTSGLNKLVSLTYLYSVSAIRNSIGFVSKRRFDLLLAFWKAVWWNLTHYRGVLSGLPQL